MKVGEKVYSLGFAYREKVFDPYCDTFKGILSIHQRLLLEALYREETLTQKELVGIINIPKQHVSLVANSLIENGYIEKEIVEKDRRSSSLRLTQKGKKFIQEHIEENAKRIEEKFVELDEEQKEKLLDAMTVVENFFNSI